MISRTLGQRTVAYMSNTSGGSVSSHGGGWMQDSQGANIGFSTGESVQYAAQPLMQPDALKALLSPWVGKGLRRGVLELSSAARPFLTFLSSYENSAECFRRVGAATREAQP
jgi:hypothetical protein